MDRNTKFKRSYSFLHRTFAPVSIIIVNWNANFYLERCIQSVIRQTILPVEIIVFDNDSTDNSVKRVAEKFPNVRIIESKNNFGFSKANNIAVKESSSKSEWIIFLNPDAFPEPNWVENLLNAANANPCVSIFASCLLNATSPSVVDGVGDEYHVSGIVWRSGHGMKKNSTVMISREIFSPCAAAAMFKKTDFIDAGGFDEDFFCFVEDVDLGFRMRLLGHKCLFVPDAVALHVGSAVTGKNSEFAIYHGHRNLVWAYIKNMPNLLFWTFLPCHIIMTIFTVFYYTLKNQSKIIIKAKLDAIRGIKKMWKKRQKIQSKRVVSTRKIWRVLNKKIIPNG